MEVTRPGRPSFGGQGCQGILAVAMLARLYQAAREFSGKPDQKRGKPGRVFGRAPDASIYPRYIRLTDNAWQTNWQ